MSNVALADRRNTIIGVVGRKGSGKTRLIAEVVGGNFPRRITLDWTGECAELYPHAVPALGLAETINTVEELHRASPAAWHVVAIMEPEHAGALLTALAPRFGSGASSLSAALGGVCVECSEIDVIAPVSGAGSGARAVMEAIARGRHHRLSFVWATQRPHQCARILSSQLDTLISFRMHEPRDVAWLARVGGEPYARLVRSQLQQYHSAWFDAQTGTVKVLDARYRTIVGLTVSDVGIDSSQLSI